MTLGREAGDADDVGYTELVGYSDTVGIGEASSLGNVDGGYLRNGTHIFEQHSRPVTHSLPNM